MVYCLFNETICLSFKANSTMIGNAVDLFCGIGGLSLGLKKAGIRVGLGIDLDKTCQYAYEKNIKADFWPVDITEVQAEKVQRHCWSDDSTPKILVGCAPCQPFSSHTFKQKGEKHKKWHLLQEFSRLVKELSPDIISMENVPNLRNKEIFKEFVAALEAEEYQVSSSVVYCPDYGIPQKRKRLVLMASKHGKLNLLEPTHQPEHYKTTKDAIGELPPVKDGEVAKNDKLHRASKLSKINKQRIKSSKPNGTWLDWDESLRLACHRKKSGSTYKSVYGRMSWDEPAPTITTQFYNFGTGRFGHPEQDRAITIREAAILQTFPKDYIFTAPEDQVLLTRLGRHIGNAVPVDLGYVIGLSIKKHLEDIS